MNKIGAYGLVLAAVLAYLLSALAFLTMLYAMTVTETLVAIESAFGSFVIALILLGLGRLSWLSGQARLKADRLGESAGDTLADNAAGATTKSTGK